ncbi:hypothetical protein FQN52_005468 [Onygenales sp. PD_12]|nr:hypothetical protein FQN52_005468 [Onygenales sp. PD_12]
MAEQSTDSDPVGPIYHEINPNGDVLLILQKPRMTSFEPWDDNVEAQLPSFNRQEYPFEALPRTTRKGKKGRKNPNRLLEEPPPLEPLEPIDEIAIENAEPSSSANNGEATAAQAHDLPEVQMLVSSQHLILASTHFKKMLQSTFKEGKTPSSSADGPNYREIPVTMNWNPSALLILMNIIHGRTRKVPRSIDLDMLTEMAKLVDYHDCAEAVEVFSDMWVEKLRDSMPKRYGREVIMWLSVACAFRKSDVLREVTAIATMENRGVIQQMELRIPGSVISAIEERRLQSITEVLDLLYDLKEDFGAGKGKELCSFECTSLFVGCLALGMRKCGLYPRPEAPFLGLSFAEFEMRVRKIESLKWPYCRRQSDWEECAGPADLIQPTLDKVRGEMAGLTLEEIWGASGGELSDKRSLDS